MGIRITLNIETNGDGRSRIYLRWRTSIDSKTDTRFDRCGYLVSGTVRHTDIENGAVRRVDHGE